MIDFLTLSIMRRVEDVHYGVILGISAQSSVSHHLSVSRFVLNA